MHIIGFLVTAGYAGIGQADLCFRCVERVQIETIGNFKLPICLLQSPLDAGCGHCCSAKEIQGSYDDRV